MKRAFSFTFTLNDGRKKRKYILSYCWNLEAVGTIATVSCCNALFVRLRCYVHKQLNEKRGKKMKKEKKTQRKNVHEFRTLRVAFPNQ